MAEEDVSDVLLRTGASRILRDALCLLVEHRPANPIDVLIEHFQSAQNAVHPVTAAYRIVRLAKGHTNLRTQHIADAYASIATTSNKGLHGLEFMELVGMLCVDFSPRASDVILKVFRKQEYEAVSFTEFATAVSTCLFYEEFLDGAEQVFLSIDSTQSGYASQQVCEYLLRTLADTATTSFHDGHNTQLVTAQNVTMEQKLESLMNEKGGLQVKLSTFVQSASSLFLKILVTFGAIERER